MLFYHEGPFACSECNQETTIVPETGHLVREPGQLVGLVQVHFDYSMDRKGFTKTILVQDRALGTKVGSYELYLPVCRTEKRAFEVAENLLARINSGEQAEVLSRPWIQERVLDLAQPREYVRQWLEDWSSQMQANPFFQERTPVVSQK